MCELNVYVSVGLGPVRNCVVGSEKKAQPSGSNRTLRAHGTVWENSPNQSRRQDFPLTCGLYLTLPVSVQMSLERCTPRSNVFNPLVSGVVLTFTIWTKNTKTLFQNIFCVIQVWNEMRVTK